MNLEGVIAKLKLVSVQLLDTGLPNFERVSNILGNLKELVDDATGFFQESQGAPIMAVAPKKVKKKNAEGDEEVKEVEPDRGVTFSAIQELRVMKSEFEVLASRSPAAVGILRKGRAGGFNPHFEVAMFRVVNQLASEIIYRLENKK